MSFHVVRLQKQDISEMRALLRVFAIAFEEEDVDAGDRPSDAYLADLLSAEQFAAFVAIDDASGTGNLVVGGLTVHYLPTYHHAGCDAYIYDLAVAESHRREGAATALMVACRSDAGARGAGVLWVQAHAVDSEAVAFYASLGLEGEAVRHFEFAPDVRFATERGDFA